ncbi:MAG: nucleoside triphosphate pyrophosphohydrolase [Clostridia bacterium]|nr:nucleoside triphosphate pyrophosphohydrolase [Clostridia bacterium]
MDKKYTIDDLLDIVSTLRGENGCPWDKAQTHESIKKSMIEEAYEAIDALDSGDDRLFSNELGDVLLQVVFHSQIAKERGAFDFDDCLREVCTKLISRHSHVFGDDKAGSAEESLKVWEKNKNEEKGLSTYTETLDDVPHSLPALMRAEKVQKKAAAAGFDWNDISGAFEKIKEEADELAQATAENDEVHIEEELGDLLFSVVNVSRFLKVEPEIALMKAINKFINRFSSMEHMARSQGKDMKNLSLRDLDDLWEKAKA